MFQLTRAFGRAVKAPPIAPSALSDFRAVGRGGASRRLRRQAALRAAMGRLRRPSFLASLLDPLKNPILQTFQNPREN